MVLFQGQQVRLEDVHSYATDQIDEEFLTQLVKDEVPELVNNQVPDKLEYYIQRKVMTGNRLKLQVLQGDHDDVFLIEGMQKYELTKLVGRNATTDVSGNQIIQLTVRFIHLQHNGDFGKICKLATTPVHWIKYIQNGFVWVKSSGSVEALQRYVENEQDSVEEIDLVSGNNKIVVICDSPGMGKTVLLHSIAHEIMKQSPTVLVRFIVLKELVQGLERREINTESLVKLIGEQSSEYEYGRELVAHALKTSDCVLLFDGFDEVLPNQIHSAEQILTVAVELKSARVFITTRPHMREALENTLHVLGHTIKPFEHYDQIEFLMKYWNIEGAKRNESLQQFTTACLGKLSTKMTDFEREIAGIPLQCRLLAEVYTDHAIRCSEIGYEAHQESIDLAVITSMFDMYEMHINMRFEKIHANEDCSNQFELVKKAHMCLALLLLFPDHVDEVKLLNVANSITSQQIFSLGIVEDTQSGVFRFVHRTFAEYIVAWITVEVGLESKEFIISQVLSTKSNQLYWRHLTEHLSKMELLLKLKQGITEQEPEPIEHPFYNLTEENSFEFNFPVICYFINGFTQKQKNMKSSVPSIMNSNLYTQVAPVFTASAYHDYAHIPAFVASCFGDNVIKNTQNNKISDLLLVTAKNSGVEMIKTFCSCVDMRSMKFLITEPYVLLPFMITPLHVAVMRGNYQIVEYLLNKFEGIYHKLEYLIHFCVFGSMKDSKSTLNDKKEIIRLLMEKNKVWADEPLLDKSTPLLQKGVSLELVECLIQQGADVNVKDKYNNNLLHRVVAKNQKNSSIGNYVRFPISPESYHQILLALQERDFQHFNTANDNNVTPLQCTLQNIRLLEESVRIFHSVGADFNAVDKQGDSLLFYAIVGGVRSMHLIPLMIELGANTKHINLIGQGVLHNCAHHGNYEALQFLLGNYEVDINAEDIHACTPLHYAVLGRSESYKSLQMLLINKGADLIARDEMNMTPFDRAFAEGKGLRPDVIQAMEKRGLKISKQLASKALTHSLFNTNIYAFGLDQDFANMLEYLIGKGGESDFRFTQNLWDWEVVQKQMLSIIENTIIRSSLLNKAKTCGLFEGLKKMEHFYDVVKEKAISFERIFMILLADTQYGALDIFIQCLKEAKERFRSITFSKLPSGVEEFIKSDYLRVFVLQTSNADLSIKRIQDNISKDVIISVEDDLANQTQEEWIIVKCDVCTDELFNTLVRMMRSRVLCICSITSRKSGSIVRDTFTWEDISIYYTDKIWFRRHGNLFNIVHLFASPATIVPTIWDVFGELKSNAFFEIAKFSIGHQIDNPDNCIYLSTTIFHYFILDKLAFVGISLEELNDLGKYGQKVGVFGDNIHKLDYMVLEEKNQFREICRNTDCNVHLIEYHEGRFRLLKSRGSHKNLWMFFKEKLLCGDFPSCNCTSEYVFVNLSLQLEEDGGEMLYCCVNVTEIQPFMFQIFNMQDSLELYELRKLYQDLREQDYAATEQTTYKHPFSNHIVKLVEDTVKHLECSFDERKLLQRVAVKTLFPEINADIEISTTTRFVETGLLEKKEGSLAFHNHTIAWYFIAELVVNGNQLYYTYVDEIRKAILSDCFQPDTVQVSHKWWEKSVYSSDKIKTFRFSNDMLFRFIESHLSDDVDTTWLENQFIPQSNNSLLQLSFGKTKNFITKCVHACVFGNHRKLLNIILEHSSFKQLLSKQIIVLAVMCSEVETVELVAQAYSRETNEKLQNITLELRNDQTGYISTVTLLHIAALRGNAGVFQYLLNNGFKQLRCEPILRNILHFCVIDTHANEREVGEKKQMIEFVLEIQPNLINETYLNATPLLVPNINIDLLMHLVNLGADVYSFDASSQNILHLSTCYFTPEEYHALVSYVHKRGYSKLLNAKSDNKSTPLHIAVKYLEILDTTVELFSSANIDFNALDDEKNTALIQVLVNGKTARLLDSLITCGSEIDLEKYHEYNTALHLAAKHGNLSGVRYFIFRGIDVNSTNPGNFTPLYSALFHCQQKTLIHGIVQSLVELGADVNATMNYYTPLTMALIMYKNGNIQDRTTEFLKERGAEEFAALKDVGSRLRKLQMGIIARNMEKLVEETISNKSLLDTLTERGTLTERDMEKLNTETDGKTQAAMLYDILLRKKPDLQEFMTTLQETNQTEPYDLIMTETLNSDQVKRLLRDAVINMEYDAVEYLVKGQRLSNLLFDPYLESIIHDCMDTLIITRPMIDDKFKIIRLVLGINQGLINSKNKENLTPLQKAIVNHGEYQLDLIRWLIDHKADVNARGLEDYTPLHFAVAQKITPPNVIEIIKILIESCADPDALDEFGRTFLHWAPKTFTPELYGELIEYFDSTNRGNSFKMVDKDNWTNLHMAVRYLEPFKSTLDMFKKHGLDFNALDEYGNSVIFHAIEGGRSASFITTLISFGVVWRILNKDQDNPLHRAAYYSNFDALIMFISLGCDVNASNLQGRTPLHRAVLAKNINLEVIKELMKHGADVNAKNNNENNKDPDNRTPLHLALFNHDNKQLELIRLLIDNKADVNERDSEQYTPLQISVTQKITPPKMLEIIKALIESGADPDAVDEDGHTFLHIAPQFITPELYAELIEYFDSESRKKSLKMADNHKRTHLHCAVRFLEPLKSTLEIFKKHGLDFNGVGINGISVLYIAIKGGRSASFLKTFISFGVNWTILDNNQDNPLHITAYFSNLDTLKMFLSLGCDVNASNLHRNTPLHYAVLTKKINLEVIKELIKHGADVNTMSNDNKRTPLHHAIINHGDKQLELIRLLIDHKADVNARDSIHYTPLYMAVAQKPLPPNVMEIIKLLIENGADPDAGEEDGCTFLHRAPQTFTPELYGELIQYFDSTNRGNSFKMTDNNNWTHLHHAVSVPNFEPLHSTLEIFKKHGLDFNALDNDGDSVVHDAIEGGRIAEFLQTLFTFGADWTILNKKQETPLHLTATFGNLSALKLFLSFGYDVDLKNILGHTPLHNAFLGKRYGEEIMTDHEVVKELLENGADINARDNEGKLPIDLAKQRARTGKVEAITVNLLEPYLTFAT